MIPKKGKIYKIVFQDNRYPEDTHYVGCSMFTGKELLQAVEDDNGKLYDDMTYGFDLVEHPEMGTCYFQERYIFQEEVQPLTQNAGSSCL